MPATNDDVREKGGASLSMARMCPKHRALVARFGAKFWATFAPDFGPTPHGTPDRPPLGAPGAEPPGGMAWVVVVRSASGAFK